MNIDASSVNRCFDVHVPEQVTEFELGRFRDATLDAVVMSFDHATARERLLDESRQAAYTVLTRAGVQLVAAAHVTHDRTKLSYRHNHSSASTPRVTARVC